MPPDTRDTITHRSGALLGQLLQTLKRLLSRAFLTYARPAKSDTARPEHQALLRQAIVQEEKTMDDQNANAILLTDEMTAPEPATFEAECTSDTLEAPQNSIETTYATVATEPVAEVDQSVPETYELQETESEATCVSEEDTTETPILNEVSVEASDIPEKTEKVEKLRKPKKIAKSEKREKKEKKSKHPDPYCINRELSWLQFNERCLNEAANPKVPLAERLTFISIFQTNLDEFFMVRVGTLMMQMKADPKDRDNKTRLTAREQVSAILRQVSELRVKYNRVYRQLMGELEPQGIRLINFDKLSVAEAQELELYFDAHISPFLSPMLVDKQQPFPFLDNKLLYAVVILTNVKGKRRMGLVPCSSRVFPRLIEIPTRPGNFMLSEELILHFIQKLYPRYLVREKSVLRITRNADTDAIELFDEGLDYRDSMEKLIKKRRHLGPVRAELSRSLSDKTRKDLAAQLNISDDHIYRIKCPLDMSFVSDLQTRLRGKQELFYQKRIPQDSPAIDKNLPVLQQVEKQDVLLFYPYETMEPFLRMLEELPNDPDVVSIKMTLYRLADRSRIVEALVAAAEQGKEVVVVVELRARFDEAHNIEASRRLEDAGCTILYGPGSYKVHSKLCLIQKKTPDGYSYITQVGTGNYNEKTSRLYTDLCLITADQEIGEDAETVFRALQQGETVDQVNRLLVAPNCLQNRITDLIDGEIQKARLGYPAYIGIKINSLTDKVLIDRLVAASQAGVQIELIVRGICCLVPRLPGYTDNITVVSIVGRYLEHARIYRFGIGEEEQIYIASADFMTRNTTRRVEVAAPVLAPALKQRIDHIFETQMQDDEKGKQMGADALYHDRDLGGEKLNSQELFYAESYEAASN